MCVFVTSAIKSFDSSFNKACHRMNGVFWMCVAPDHLTEWLNSAQGHYKPEGTIIIT